jgi:hypothetical protein
MMKSFPLLGLSLLLYVGLHSVTESTRPWSQSQAFSIMLPSGDEWHISGGDVFLMSTLTLLVVELIRSTRSDQRTLINHGLDVVVFVAALTLFLSQAGYGNSTFFALLLMTLVDFVAGFIITAASARRDVSVGHSRPHTSPE